MAENRIRDFKFKGKDTTELRGRRRDAGIELRKNKREEQMLKKRNVDEESPSITSPLGEQKSQATGVNVGELPSLAEMIKYGDIASQLTATTRCRMILSKERNPPINDVIAYGLVPYFVDFLARDDLQQLQFEAAWALTNIASGTSEQTLAVASANAIPSFIRLLSSANQEVQEQAVWALGNIAGDGPKLRDAVIDAGILYPLVSLIQTSSKTSILRNATWTLSNLCRGKGPQPNFAAVSPAIPTIRALLSSTDDEVITDACWAVSYLSDGENFKIQAIIDGGMIPRLIELLAHPVKAVQTPALRAIGNIVTGSEKQTQDIVDAGALPSLARMYAAAADNSIRKEICWTVSNITAGSVRQIQAVIEAGLIPAMIEALRSGDFKTRKEASWAIANLTTGGTEQQIRYLAEQGAIQPVLSMLSTQDAKLLQVTLDCISNFLRAGEMPDGSNPCATYIEECGGLDSIEALQQHENMHVYEKALKIIEEYFSEEDGTDQEVPSGGFNFQADTQALSMPTAFSF